MKTFPLISLSLLCGTALFIGTFSAAFAAEDGFYEYRSKKPDVEMAPNPDNESTSFQTVHLQPPIRPLLTPPAAAPEPLPEATPPQPQPKNVKAVPAPPPPPPKYLLSPFFTQMSEIPAPPSAAAAPAPVTEKIVTPPGTPVHVDRPENPVQENPQPAHKPETVKRVEKTAQEIPHPAETTKTAESNQAPEKVVNPPVNKASDNPPTHDTAKAPGTAPAVPTHADLSVVFDKNSSTPPPEAEKSLDTIVAQMNSLPDTRLQIRAYATGEDGNSSSARRMALSRALMVRAYMTDKGIKPIRLDVRALGSETDKAPTDRVDLVFVR
ncbi:MAG: OmpA family protein [Proteobacteria bacterium]|nr:OmpA family protein [Pseudomonadota bacterium]